MNSFVVKDINTESAVVFADINVPEVEQKMLSNNQKSPEGKRIHYEKRKRSYNLPEENLSDTKQDNAPIPGSLGKYFVYVNCTECKVKSELLVKSKIKSKSRNKTTKKGLKLYRNKSLIQDGERRVVPVEHDEERYQNEEMSMDKESRKIKFKNKKDDIYDATLHYITNVDIEDGKIYEVTDVDFTYDVHSKETSIENTSEKVTTEGKTTEEKTTAEITSGVSTNEEKSTELKTTGGGESSSEETTKEATTGINTTGGETTVGKGK